MEKKRFVFTVIMEGVGESQDEAWKKAVLSFLGLDEHNFFQMTAEDVMEVKSEPLQKTKSEILQDVAPDIANVNPAPATPEDFKGLPEINS